VTTVIIVGVSSSLSVHPALSLIEGGGQDPMNPEREREPRISEQHPLHCLSCVENK